MKFFHNSALFLGLASTLVVNKAFAQTHSLFLVGTSGSTYRLGYLKPGSYTAVLSSCLAKIPHGSTATVIAYDSDAGFYPARTTAHTIQDILSPIRTQIKESRDYWSQAFVKTSGDLSKASRAGSRLDKALTLAMEDRVFWAPNSLVNVYILTDGGVDLRRSGQTPAQSLAEFHHAKKVIESSFKTLWGDPRIKQVSVFGLKEQPSVRYPSDIYGEHSIVQQWANYWLKGAQNIQFLQLPK